MLRLWVFMLSLLHTKNTAVTSSHLCAQGEGSGKEIREVGPRKKIYSFKKILI